MREESSAYIIRVLCQDAKGIVNWVTGLISAHGGNIVDLEQHSDKESCIFAMRLVVEDLKDIIKLRDEFNQNIKHIDKFQFWINQKSKKQRVAILVTKEQACLYDILIQQRINELFCDIPMVISNHTHLSQIAGDFGLPFYHLPIDPDDKLKQENQLHRLLEENKIDLIVLARYMRILSNTFVKNWSGKVINIHHSFLPAFKGAKPYHQAWHRGVKLIGATSHYVTAELDEGPIIHQDATSVSHRHSVKEFATTGRNLERNVLSFAMKAHLEHRIILSQNKTIVFN